MGSSFFAQCHRRDMHLKFDPNRVLICCIGNHFQTLFAEGKQQHQTNKTANNKLINNKIIVPNLQSVMLYFFFDISYMHTEQT